MTKERLLELIPNRYKFMYRNLVSWKNSMNLERRNLPDFIIIGVQKGGTSTLFSLLERHPQIKGSVFKEVHYYDYNFSKGIKWYRSFFPIKSSLTRLVGEASPYYFFHPLVPNRIKQDNPNVKLILLLRDPVARAYSHYQMERRKHKEKIESFEEAIEVEESRIAPEIAKMDQDPFYFSSSHQTYSYVSRGYYGDQLERWYKYFDRDQILVLKSEDFFGDPSAIIKKVYDFLDVDDFQDLNFQPKNQGNYGNMKHETVELLKEKFRKDQVKLNELLDRRIDW